MLSNVLAVSNEFYVLKGLLVGRMTNVLYYKPVVSKVAQMSVNTMIR